MKDKRIKLITVEVFILWGAISTLSYMSYADSVFMKHTYPLLPFYGKFSVLFFSFFKFDFKVLYYLSAFFNINADYVFILYMICKLSFFWLLGICAGKIFVWLKRIANKLFSEKESICLGTKNS